MPPTSASAAEKAVSLNAQLCMSVDVCSLLDDLCADSDLQKSAMCTKATQMCAEGQSMFLSKADQMAKSYLESGKVNISTEPMLDVINSGSKPAHEGTVKLVPLCKPGQKIDPSSGKCVSA